MSKRIKIAIYSGIVPSTTFIERLSKGLAGKGSQVFIFGLKKGSVPSLPNSTYITYSNKLSKLLLLIKYTFLLFLIKPKEKRKLDKIISRSKKKQLVLRLKYYPVLYHCPDIFHLQWAKSIEDWVWVQEFGIKLILSLRGAHINYSPLTNSKIATTYKAFFPKVDGFHAVSKAISLEAMKYHAAMPKIKLVYSGLELERMPFQLKIVDANTPLKILSIGRAHWIKGYTYALNSAYLLKVAGVDFQYTIVGVGSNEELIYQRSQLELENEVVFLENLSFEEVIESIRQADVLLLSSLKEGIANVVLEAMALGTLVISTNCGGMDEVIVDNENGFLVPIRNSEAMASALKSISELPLPTYQKIATRARNTIEKQHNHEKMVAEMLDLYQKVLNTEL